MFTKVSKSVYCRVGEKGSSNNGIVACDDFSIVVDTATYPEQTEKDLEGIKKVTDKPIKFLINTHYHGDHTFGNMYFSDIIAHTACYRILKDRIPYYKEQMQKDEEFKNLEIKLPNILFAEKMMLHYTPRIELIHFGGHTEGSAVVYIPEEKVLFVGDLIFAGYHPYLGDGDIPAWITASSVGYKNDNTRTRKSVRQKRIKNAEGLSGNVLSEPERSEKEVRQRRSS